VAGSKTKEFSRFSESGKTFFFNRGVAGNGTPYLAINAIYGQGNQQRLVLFPPHYLQFHQHLEEAIEKLTGFSAPGQGEIEVPKFATPTKCPDCGSNCDDWRVVALTADQLKLICKECDEVVFVLPEETQND